MENNKLLSREDFKRLVFERSNGKCCVPGCQEDAVDAHHIIERHLFSDNGYYLSNGAGLCAKHHLDAENGVISPKELLEINNIDKEDIVVPDSLGLSREDYIELLYNGELDKWGELVETKPYDEHWFEKFKKS